MSEPLSARVRALAADLAALRRAAGLNTRQAAAKVGISSAGLNRIENGKRVPLATEVSALLAIYNASSKDRERLMDMVREINTPSWLETSANLPRLLPTLVQLESEAVSIIHFAPSLVPGLLQTRAYAQAILDASSTPVSHQEAHLAARMGRQEILKKVVPPDYVAILDEAVLRRPYGGTAAMATQIHWLIGRAKTRGISIHVIPFRHGGYDNPGQYALMKSRDEPPILYAGHGAMAGFLHTEDEVRQFQGITSTLMKIALDSTESVNFLARMAADYERS
jgi:transcriptional regulator with XRE-family HTH domain